VILGVSVGVGIARAGHSGGPGRMVRSGHGGQGVASMSTEQADGLLASGHALLARGDWPSARAAFEAACTRQESPEALEGLGTAVWWLDDAGAVFAARERAYRLYRRRGDRLAAARVATMLGVDAFHFRGQTAVARGWHHRAHRLLDGLPTASEHAWLRLWRSEISLATGDDAGRVRDVAAEALAIGRQLGDVDVEMMALAQEGVALVMRGDVQAGMPRLDEAATAALSGDMVNPLAIGIACCHLVTACELVRDLGRAAEWCERLREQADRLNFKVLVAVCRTQHASVLMWAGDWRQAEAELERAVALFARSRPSLREHALVRLAELRRRQGRYDDADALLDRIEWHPHARLLRAAIALDRGNAAAAADLARCFLERAPSSNRTDRALGCELRLRAQLALGTSPDPRALEEIRAVAAGVGTDVLRAWAQAAEGLVAAAEGRPERARGALEEAVGLLARAGAGYEAARTRVELGRALIALGQGDAARLELQRACCVFEALGAAGDAHAARALLRQACGRGAPARPGGLSVREIEVIRLLAQGLHNGQIACRLGVSEFTVKRHVANILTKLDVPTRAAAAAHAARRGWL
jgi:DNA-binding CsgD family transcriptional regulator/predicted negative regulator of RcsB-dependent stress response